MTDDIITQKEEIVSEGQVGRGKHLSHWLSLYHGGGESDHDVDRVERWLLKLLC